MSLTPHDPANEPGADAHVETPTRAPPRGIASLSVANRKRLLAALSKAAQSGGIAAQQALIELSFAAQRDEQIAAALKRLQGEGGG